MATTTNESARHPLPTQSGASTSSPLTRASSDHQPRSLANTSSPSTSARSLALVSEVDKETSHDGNDPASSSTATAPRAEPVSRRLNHKRRAASIDVDQANHPRINHLSLESPAVNADGVRDLICICPTPPKVPRPRNAFILYRQHHQAQVVADNPGCSNPEVSKIIGEQWKAESEKVTSYWRRLAEDEKVRHQTQYPDYRYQPRRGGKAGISAGLPGRPGSAVNDSARCPKCNKRFIATPRTPLTATTAYTPTTAGTVGTAGTASSVVGTPMSAAAPPMADGTAPLPHSSPRHNGYDGPPRSSEFLSRQAVHDMGARRASIQGTGANRQCPYSDDERMPQSAPCYQQRYPFDERHHPRYPDYDDGYDGMVMSAGAPTDSSKRRRVDYQQRLLSDSHYLPAPPYPASPQYHRQPLPPASPGRYQGVPPARRQTAAGHYPPPPTPSAGYDRSYAGASVPMAAPRAMAPQGSPSAAMPDRRVSAAAGAGPRQSGQMPPPPTPGSARPYLLSPPIAVKAPAPGYDASSHETLKLAPLNIPPGAAAPESPRMAAGTHQRSTSISDHPRLPAPHASAPQPVVREGVATTSAGQRVLPLPVRTAPAPATPANNVRATLTSAVGKDGVTEKDMEAMVATIPHLNKITVLRKLSPPYKTKGGGVRGPVIAIEGPNSKLCEQIGGVVEKAIRRSGECDLKVWSADKAEDKPAASTFTEYLGLMNEWHIKSGEIISHITSFSSSSSSSSSSSTTSSSGSSSSDSPPETSEQTTTADEKKDKDHEMTPPPSPSTTAPANKPNKTRVSLLTPQFSLSLCDTYATTLPIGESYSPVDHWQWMAALWRGIVGADLVVYVKPFVEPTLAGDKSAGEKDGEKKGAKSGAAEEGGVEMKIAGSVMEVLSGRDGVSEKVERRVAFEVMEWIRAGGFGQS